MKNNDIQEPTGLNSNFLNKNNGADFFKNEKHDKPKKDEEKTQDMVASFYRRLKGIIKKPYCYIPDCPRCKSRSTGRFKKATAAFDEDNIIDDALRHGEIVAMVAELPEDPLFCLNCGFTWYEPITTRWLTLEEIDREKTERKTTGLYNERHLQEKEEKKNKPFFKRHRS